jgi:Tol biopolymer transport system component
VSGRSAHTIRSGIECPSLSPDQTRIAYKSRVDTASLAVTWRLHVFDLRTGADVALSETRSVDDQVEWLNNTTVLYAILRSPVGTAIEDTYSAPADGGGKPSLYLESAWSPAVGR